MKLSLDALKERAEAVASNDLLASISGGTNDACHDTPAPSTPSTPVKWEIEIKHDTNTTISVPTTVKF